MSGHSHVTHLFAVLRPCSRCGVTYAYRYEAERPKPEIAPATVVEALCDACFDAWCWAHSPQDAPDAGSALEALADE